MELHNGWVVKSLEDYEVKQQEQAELIEIKGRYAGRVIKGVVIPDVTLINGNYFIPSIDSTGTDNIAIEEIKHNNFLK